MASVDSFSSSAIVHNLSGLLVVHRIIALLGRKLRGLIREHQMSVIAGDSASVKMGEAPVLPNVNSGGRRIVEMEKLMSGLHALKDFDLKHFEEKFSRLLLLGKCKALWGKPRTFRLVAG